MTTVLKPLPGGPATFRKPLDATNDPVCCVLCAMLLHLPFDQFILTSSSILGFNYCQRMKYFCRVKEPVTGIFPIERETSTNYPTGRTQARTQVCREGGHLRTR